MLAIIDCRMPRSAQLRLSELGFTVIPLPPFSRLAPPVASHPDMLILPLGDRIYVHHEYYCEASAPLHLIAEKSERKLCTVDTNVAPKYPRDIGLNLFCLDKYLFGRVDCAPQPVLDYAHALGYQSVFVKQGYAKCSTAVLDDRALITADPSISHAAKALGIDVLSVSPGGVSLPGYECGFLGGACGVWNRQVFFCGDIMTHPNGLAIIDFCHANGFGTVSLYNGPLWDVGSIFFL